MAGVLRLRAEAGALLAALLALTPETLIQAQETSRIHPGSEPDRQVRAVELVNHEQRPRQSKVHREGARGSPKVVPNRCRG